MSSEKKVSIILPVYNASKFLKECLDSILKQTYTNYEIVVVDDGSTDNSYTIAKEYANINNRIKIIKNIKNLGVSCAMNTAINVSRGRYISVMNADDKMHPKRLQKQVDFLESNSEYIVIGSQVKLIDEYGKKKGIKKFPTSHKDIYRSLYLTNPIQHSSMTINRRLLPQDFTWYNEDLRLSEDIDLLFRLLKYGKLANHNEILTSYRIHKESLTKMNTKQMYLIGYRARKRGKNIHGYKPSILNSIILNISLAIVVIIPTNLLLPVFYKLRSYLLRIS